MLVRRGAVSEFTLKLHTLPNYCKTAKDDVTWVLDGRLTAESVLMLRTPGTKEWTQPTNIVNWCWRIELWGLIRSTFPCTTPAAALIDIKSKLCRAYSSAKNNSPSEFEICSKELWKRISKLPSNEIPIQSRPADDDADTRPIFFPFKRTHD